MSTKALTKIAKRLHDTFGVKLRMSRAEILKLVQTMGAEVAPATPHQPRLTPRATSGVRRSCLARVSAQADPVGVCRGACPMTPASFVRQDGTEDSSAWASLHEAHEFLLALSHRADVPAAIAENAKRLAARVAEGIQRTGGGKVGPERPTAWAHLNQGLDGDGDLTPPRASVRTHRALPTTLANRLEREE